jgi:hypothetical protein
LNNGVITTEYCLHNTKKFSKNEEIKKWIGTYQLSNVVFVCDLKQRSRDERILKERNS